MVSIKTKKIKGRQYLYAEHSFRLPDSRVKKISKHINGREEINEKKVKEYFLQKETEAYQEFALTKYQTDTVLTKDKIKKIETFRVEYKKILNSLSKKQMSDILDRFTINFTYESNAIEGNSLTLKDVALLLTEKIVPKDKELREIYETRNAREANELLFKNKIKINIRDIMNLHKIIVKDTGVSTGFKKLPNFLVLRNVKTTPPEKVEDEMNKLFSWYIHSKANVHPINLASEFHGRFEKIHPFEDGNGRVGRILINAILLENGYPPLIIRKTMRTSYFSALEAHDKGYGIKLIRFLLEKFENTFNKFFRIYVNYL